MKELPRSDSLDRESIRANLRTRRVGKSVVVFDSTSSTNDVAAQYAKGQGNDGLAIFAEEQTQGRGRGGNAWLSGKGQSILCSIVLTKCQSAAELLSLACAVAVAETIGKAGSHEAKVKWPNDIMLGGRKVAGILLESKINDWGNAYIFGIGINCHQDKGDLPDEIRDSATSIDIESRKTCDRVTLAKRLLSSMDKWIARAEKNKTAVTERWSELSIQLGHRVAVIYNGRRFTGNCIGVDPEKGLILQLDRGGVRMFDAAHTSIVKATASGQS